MKPETLVLFFLVKVLLISLSSFSLAGCGEENSSAQRINMQPDSIPVISKNFTIKEIEDLRNKIKVTKIRMDSIKTDVFGQSSEGGQVIGFYNSMGLSKLEAIFYGEMGKAFEDFYLIDNQLIAYRQAIHKYAQDATTNHEDHAHDEHHDHDHEPIAPPVVANIEVFEVLFSDHKVLEARVGEGVTLETSDIDYILESVNVYADLLKKKEEKS